MKFILAEECINVNKTCKKAPRKRKMSVKLFSFLCEYNFPRLLVQNEGFKMEVRVSIKLDSITFLHFIFDI